MIISDLNYLETAETSAVVGGIYFGGRNSNVNANLNVKERFDVQKIYKQYVNIKGNLATAESEALGKIPRPKSLLLLKKKGSLPPLDFRRLASI
jgi:hypothetical protein